MGLTAPGCFAAVHSTHSHIHHGCSPSFRLLHGRDAPLADTIRRGQTAGRPVCSSSLAALATRPGAQSQRSTCPPGEGREPGRVRRSERTQIPPLDCEHDAQHPSPQSPPAKPMHSSGPAPSARPTARAQRPGRCAAGAAAAAGPNRALKLTRRGAVQLNAIIRPRKCEYNKEKDGKNDVRFNTVAHITNH